MPKKDGFTFVREVRQSDQSTPVIFLTAKSLKEDRIEGFKIGGDDYITKPFSMEELLLRIAAVLKRSAPAGEKENGKQLFTIGKYRFNYAQSTLVYDARKKISLTTKESELLRVLCQHPNSTVTRIMNGRKTTRATNTVMILGTNVRVCSCNWVTA